MKISGPRLYIVVSSTRGLAHRPARATVIGGHVFTQRRRAIEEAREFANLDPGDDDTQYFVRTLHFGHLLHVKRTVRW